MKLSWNRLALVVGVFILTLLALDGLIQTNNAALKDFGFGEGPLVAADSAAALFMVGLITGVVLGISSFFAYLVWREKRYREETDDIALLLEEVAAEEMRDVYHAEERPSEERAETLEPWERSADWWMSADDD